MLREETADLFTMAQGKIAEKKEEFNRLVLKMCQVCKFLHCNWNDTLRP